MAPEAPGPGTGASRIGRAWLTAWYLLATPLFAVLDHFAGISLRVAWPEEEAGRLAYYAALLGLGLVSWKAPALAPLLALLESALAVGLVLVSAYGAILGLAESPAALPLGRWLGNLVLCGGVGILAFQQAQARLRAH